jgi:hypothetical protein
MLRMCVCMHSRFVKNHPIWILECGLLISEVVLSQGHPLLVRCRVSNLSPGPHLIVDGDTGLKGITTQVFPIPL